VRCDRATLARTCIFHRDFPPGDGGEQTGGGERTESGGWSISRVNFVNSGALRWERKQAGREKQASENERERERERDTEAGRSGVPATYLYSSTPVTDRTLDRSVAVVDHPVISIAIADERFLLLFSPFCFFFLNPLTTRQCKSSNAKGILL